MRSIKTLLLIQAAILLLLLESVATFLSFEIAWLSSLLVILGSMYSYQKLVKKRVEHFERDRDPDAIDKIEDPYDLYSEEITDDDERDIKEIIKEEKVRIKANKTAGFKTGAPAMVSLYRLGPYLFLILGFIGLKNNEMLLLLPYLLGLAVGIVSGYVSGKTLFQEINATPSQ